MSNNTKDMKPIGYIYLTTCLVNGKIYVGKHEFNGQKNYIGSGTIFKRAVKKYGKDKFKRKILRLCYSLHELRVWEHVYIVKHKSYIRSIGYNIAKGDVNSSEYNPAKMPEVREKIRKAARGKTFSEETRKKISDKNKGKKRSLETCLKISKNNVGFRGKKHTIESKEKMSKSLKGRIFSEEHCKKISESLIGKNNWSRGKKRREHSIRMSGKNNPMYGSTFMWITNGIENKRFNGSKIPVGWYKGKIDRK